MRPPPDFILLSRIYLWFSIILDIRLLSNSERRNFVCRLNLRGWRSYIHEGSGCLAGILAEHEMTHLTLLPRPADTPPQLEDLPVLRKRVSKKNEVVSKVSACLPAPALCTSSLYQPSPLSYAICAAPQQHLAQS